MKKLIIGVLLLFIFLRPVQKIEPCNINTAKQALAPRIFYEQTIDGQYQSVLVTRFFHNKLGILVNEFTGCYFKVINLNFVYISTGLIGLFFWIYALYKLIEAKKIFVLVSLLFVPILSFTNFFPAMVIIAHRTLTIVGALFFLRER